MRTPVILVTGVDASAMGAATIGLQFDLPRAVVVRHHIDVAGECLERWVSDVTGIIEREQFHLEHMCVTCALREDIIPTLDRLARDGRWASIITHLPTAAEATQVCQVIAGNPRLARRLRIASVVAALDGSSVVHDLLGDDVLAERDLHNAPDDERGVGEVACAMVEYADLVVLADPSDQHAGPVGEPLVTALARPDAQVVLGCEQLDAAQIINSMHHHENAHNWTQSVQRDALPPLASEEVWRIDLRCEAPFHPGRLLGNLEALGDGAHRSRGCFWLPTRPGEILGWDGAGSQLSIGTEAPWGRAEPFTRIVVTGLGTPADHLRPAFESLLLGPAETDARHGSWRTTYDGFEPWLGPIREVA